jgi:hypothetical protein
MTRGDLGEETELQTGRIIVTTAGSLGTVLVNQYMVNNNNDSTFHVAVPINTPLNIYLIGNELPEWKLDKVVTAAQVLGTVMNYKGLCPVVSATEPIPMFGSFENVTVKDANNDGQGEPYQNGAPLALNDATKPLLQRIFSKVVLNLSCFFSDLQNGGDPLVLKSILVKTMPITSSLPVPSTNYPHTIWDANSSSYFFNSSGTDYGAYEIGDTVSYLGTPTSSDHFGAHRAFYIPEYYPSDTGSYTYLSINVNLYNSPNDPGTAREYKVVIGNGISSHDNAYMLSTSHTLPDLQVKRNTQYLFSCLLTSYSQSSEQSLQVNAHVLGWNDVVPMDSTDTYNYHLTLSSSNFDLTGTTGTYTGQVTVTTDYGGGWDAVVTNGNTYCSLAQTYSGEPSGPLQFTFTGTTGQSARIEVSTGPADGRITKYISITR